MKRISIIALTAIFILTGCNTLESNAKSRLIPQIAFDHDCPEGEIEILSVNKTVWAYKVKACGNEYKYRNIGENFFIFIDVTDGTPEISRGK